MYFAMMRFINTTTDEEYSVFQAPVTCFRQLLEQWVICEYHKGENAENQGQAIEVKGECYCIENRRLYYTGTASYNGVTEVNICIRI